MADVVWTELSEMIEGIITREVEAGYRPPTAPVLLADGLPRVAMRRAT
jgi:hypothetical protein